MKFRNKESGEIYDRWNDIPCDGKCWNCPASFDNNKYKILCSDFFRRFPHEAAAVLGCEVIEDDAPSSELSADHLTVTNNYQNYQGNKITLEWISVKDDMPKEHDSMFKKFKNTPHWKEGMFERTSDQVNVSVTFENGKRKTYTASTVDGKWRGIPIVGNPVVTHWMPLPEPPKEKSLCSKTE